MTKHNLEETGDWVFVETGFLLRASMPAHNQSTQFYTSLHSYKMDSEDASAVANNLQGRHTGLHEKNMRQSVQDLFCFVNG